MGVQGNSPQVRAGGGVDGGRMLPTPRPPPPPPPAESLWEGSLSVECAIVGPLVMGFLVSRLCCWEDEEAPVGCEGAAVEDVEVVETVGV